MNTDDLPKDRAAAKATGATHYFTGKACKHGHIAPRLTAGACVVCRKNEVQKSRKQSAAAIDAKKRYYAKNREAVIARANARPREEKRRSQQKWKAKNPDKVKLAINIRRRRHKHATPPWVGELERAKIKDLYIMAQNLSNTTGERYVVDHIVPLQGENVCGLHAPNNLRVVTENENAAKSNKHA